MSRKYLFPDSTFHKTGDSAFFGNDSELGISYEGGKAYVRSRSVTEFYSGSDKPLELFGGGIKVVGKIYLNGEEFTGGGGEMIYPPVGLAVSTGSAWDTSIANNSSNWNTAYGWGNHAGLYAPAVHTHAYEPVITKGTAGFLRWSGSDWTWDGNAYALDNHDHDGVYAEAEHDHAGVYAVAGHDHDGVYAPVGAYEPALENPISDGYVLSSSALGSRSWISPANWDAAYGWGNHAGLYQVVNADLTDILGLTGSGLLRRVGDGDWSLDGNSYAIESHNHDLVYAPIEHDHSGVYAVVGHDHDGVYAPVGAYEPIIEDPITTGLFLTSDTDGNRSWASPPGGITPTDGIWDWGTNKYQPYASKQTTLQHFYLGTSNPDVTTRLNFDGNLHATTLYSGGTIVSVAGHTHSYEPELGLPDVSGYVLSSTDAGVRSWIAMTSGVTPVDSTLLDWSTDRYQPYAAPSNGAFYTGVTSPTGTAGLNYDGYFYATQLYEGSTRVSVSGHTHAESTITFTDITTGNATTGQHGYLPKLGGGTSNFLRADGTWASPTATVADGDKGDITVSSSGVTWTIDNDVVTYAKMQNVSAAPRFMGRLTAGAGDMEELTATQVTGQLDQFSTSAATQGVVPGSNGVSTSYFLRADRTWAIPGGGPWTMLSCTADQLVTNSAVLTASSYLTFTTQANTNYHIRLRVLLNSGNSNADIKYRVTHAGTTTRVRRVRTYSIPNGTSATLPTIAPSTAFDSSDQSLLATVTGDSIVYEDIYLEVGASGGVLRFEFAQAVQTGSASVTLYRGSYMEYMSV